MRPQATSIAALALAAVSILVGSPPATATEVADGVVVDCRQPQLERLTCDYRFRNAGSLAEARAALGDTALPVERAGAYPGAGDVTAVLILVDTSDPGRRPVVERNVRQIERLVEAAAPHHQLALARFDSTLHLLAPFGASRDELRQAAAGLAAVGMTTELYRSTLEAIELLAAQDASRRALFVFSDGLAEDFAYAHEDVVRAAREHGVAIYAFGFPRDVPRSVALQSLRRLADETGGSYTGTEYGEFALPEELLAAPFAGIDSGGRLEIDLSPAIAAGAGGAQRVTLTLRAAGAAARALTVAATLPPVAPEPAPAPQVVTVQQPAAPAPPPAPAARKDLDALVWYGTPALFLLAVVAALLAYGRMWKRRAVPASVAPPAGKPFAWLVRQDDPEVRFAIAGSPWRIGRSKNNDLTLDDHSVSRQHAEIHRRHDGSFQIVDLDSLNGVFVNERKVKQSDINEGDAIDIGDVALRFTLYDEDAAAQEPTLMIRTRTP